MAAEQGKNKSKNTKYSYGQNYRRNRTETKFDTLTLANQLKHKVSVYVMNETYVPKRETGGRLRKDDPGLHINSQ